MLQALSLNRQLHSKLISLANDNYSQLQLAITLVICCPLFVLIGSLFLHIAVLNISLSMNICLTHDRLSLVTVIVTVKTSMISHYDMTFSNNIYLFLNGILPVLMSLFLTPCHHWCFPHKVLWEVGSFPKNISVQTLLAAKQRRMHC